MHMMFLSKNRDQIDHLFAFKLSSFLKQIKHRQKNKTTCSTLQKRSKKMVLCI
jgi:hypothetical protein